MIRRPRRPRRRRSPRHPSTVSSPSIDLIIDTTSLETGIAAAAIAIREMDSISLYHQRLRRERDLGLAFVRGYAATVRADLGLRDPDA